MNPFNEIIKVNAELSTIDEKVKHLIENAWNIRRSYPKEAITLSLQARTLSENHNFKNHIASTYKNTGAAYYILSQFNLALKDLELALELFKALNDDLSIAITLRNIGNVYHAMNLYEPSIELYKKALQISETVNDAQGIAYNIGNIGHVYQKMQENDTAKTYLIKARDLLVISNDSLGLSDLLNNLGNLFITEGNLTEGESNIRKALQLSISINHLRGQAISYLNLGHLRLKNKDISQAIMKFEIALAKAEEIGEQTLVIDALKNLSQSFELLNKFDKALFYYKMYEIKKSEAQEIERQIILDTIHLKTEIEKSHQENKELEKVKLLLEEKNNELELLSIVAKQTLNSILILAPDGTIEWVNNSFEELNQKSLDEFKQQFGNTIYDISNNPEIESIIDACIKTKKSIKYEAENKLKDGTVVWESSTLTPIYNSENQLSKFIIIDSDITSLKEHEKLIEAKNKDIRDSIVYAKHIQEALLPPTSELEIIFPQSFLIFNPKDIVSGDFYWFSKINNVRLLAVADCTGHGVPGAFMSLVGNEMLNITLHDPLIQSPSAALNLLDKKIKAVFSKGRQNNRAQDGMDIGLLVLHHNNLIQYSGARRPLIHIRNKVKVEHTGDKHSIGGVDESQDKCFTDKEFFVETGDMIYLFTDGYSDQFGGPKGKKIMHKNFTQYLCEISDLQILEQHEKLKLYFDTWKGNLEQVDDICMIGFRI